MSWIKITCIILFVSSFVCLIPALIGMNAFVTINRLKKFELSQCKVTGHNMTQKQGGYDAEGNVIHPECITFTVIECENGKKVKEESNCPYRNCTDSRVETCFEGKKGDRDSYWFGGDEVYQTDRYYVIMNRTWGLPVMISFSVLGFLFMVPGIVMFVQWIISRCN